MQFVKRLIPYLLVYPRLLVAGAFCLLATNGVSMFAPWVLKYAVDGLEQGISYNQLFLYGLLFVLVVLVQGVFRYAVRQTINVASRRIEYDLRNDLFGHLQTLSLPFFQQMKTGDIMSRLTNDLQSVRSLLGPGIMYSVNAVILFLAALVMMCTINIPLTLVALIPLLALPLSGNRLGKLLYERSKSVQEQLATLSGTVQETISGIRVVKAYGREPQAIEKFESAGQEYIRRNMRLVRIEGFIWPMMNLIAGIGGLVVIWIGGRQVIGGAISLGELVAFHGYLAMLTWPMIALGWVINVIQRGAAAMGRICEILDHQPDITDGPLTHDIQALSGALEFRQVSFSYNGRPVLKDLNLKIDPGMTLAVVGPTGSGKSTLIHLVPRFFDVSQGQILIDGVDIRQIPLQTLRRHMAMVPQETFLFSTTIAANIAYGAEQIVPERVREAAEIAQLLKDVEEFPEGLETLVGERGVTLSGGQKQRAAIARAVILNPRILILDDALSSVDAYTEEEILKRLQGIMRGRTSIIVSHRISAIQNADLIVVLDEGRIVEQGTHQILLARDGLYASLYEKQLLSEALEQG